MSRQFALFVVACTLIFGAMVLGHLPVLAEQTQTGARPTTDYVVNGLDDTDDGSCDVTHCSLREAISQANMDSGADTITFSVSGTIALTDTLPPISGTVTINGGNVITVDAANAHQVMRVNGGAALTLNAFTIANGKALPGGGIYNSGALTVTNGTFTGNSARNLFSGNGGAIYNHGVLVVAHSTFAGNDSGSSGGAIYNDGTVTVMDSRFSDNHVSGGGSGGGLFNDTSGTGLIVSGTFVANDAVGGGGLSNFGALVVTDCVFADNFVPGGDGGGILNDGVLTVTHSSFSGNVAYTRSGGGVYNTRELYISDSAFVGNSANLKGGGISNSNTLTLDKCLFSSNNAATGGGLANDGTLTLTNCTLTGNYASNGDGGGLYNDGTLAVLNNTLAHNTNPLVSGNDLYNSGFTAILRNTLVAEDSIGSTCSGPLPVVNGGNNLDSGSACGWGTDNGSLSNVDPHLGPLADNGGSTWTFMLRPDSPAIDGVTFNAPNDCPATDQRGVARPIGLRCDIGAFESKVMLHTFLPLMARNFSTGSK